MGLADEVESIKGVLYSKTATCVCNVRQILDLLPNEDQQVLEGLMSDPRVHGTKITKMLRNWSPKIEAQLEGEKDPEEIKRLVELAFRCKKIGESSVQRHSAKRCLCPSPETGE